MLGVARHASASISIYFLQVLQYLTALATLLKQISGYQIELRSYRPKGCRDHRNITMLGKLFGKKGSATNNTAGLSPAIAEEIRRFLGPKGLPVMPQAAQRAFELSVKPEAEAREFVEVIAGDESLSSRVVKIANSAFFDRGKKSSTVEEAVIVIGLQELRALLSAATLSELFPSRDPKRRALWEHDIAAALYARTIAERCAPELSGLCFMGGLIHDIGKLLLLQRDQQAFAKTLTAAGQGKLSSVQAEEQLLLFSHCDIGLFIAERWNFSTELKNIIAGHHRPCPPDLATRIVQCADRLIHLSPPYAAGEFAVLRRAFAEADLDPWQGIPQAEEVRELENRCRRAYQAEREIYASAP